jgi:hypothetical protein
MTSMGLCSIAMVPESSAEQEDGLDKGIFVTITVLAVATNYSATATHA